MRRIILTDLYMRQLSRNGSLTFFYETLGQIPTQCDDGSDYQVLVHGKRRDGQLQYTHAYIARIVYAAATHPGNTSNHWYKVTLEAMYEIQEL